MKLTGLLLLSASLTAACGSSCPQGTVMRGEGCVRADDVVSDRVEADSREAGAVDVVDRDATLEDGSLEAGGGDGRVCVSSDSLDEQGIDENCDGADGVASETVFVSRDGMSGATGTATSPVQTLREASWIVTNNPAIRTVLISRGAVYSSEGLDVLLARGIRVYGTYTYLRNPLPSDGPNWTRPMGELARMPTVIELSGAGTRVTTGSGAALGYVSLRTLPATLTNTTSIGLVLDGAREFVFDHTTVTASSGLAGVNGQNGARTADDAIMRNGTPGASGLAGAGGGRIVCSGMSLGIAASVGGAGGRAAIAAQTALNGFAGGGGAIGGVVFSGPIGADGAVGRAGAGGAGASTAPMFDRARVALTTAAAVGGGWGEMGQGGGGGAGGYSTNNMCVSGGGGGGGAGGCGGAPGDGGANGGHSIAVVAVGVLPTFIASELVAGGGGAGGNGGEGAEGSRGGIGGIGFASATMPECLASGRGGDGGRGGVGGGGGGGAGGWSIGLLAVGTPLGTTPSGVTIRVGTRGAAGEGGRPSGAAGIEGEARQTMQLP